VDESQLQSNDKVETDIVELSTPLRVEKFDPSRFQAETARTLAYVFTGVLAGSYLLYCVSVTVLHLWGKKDAADGLTAAFNSWLPVIAGLLGSAVGFFLSKSR
jgi:hypothetical protein